MFVEVIGSVDPGPVLEEKQVVFEEELQICLVVGLLHPDGSLEDVGHNFFLSFWVLLEQDVHAIDVKPSEEVVSVVPGFIRVYFQLFFGNVFPVGLDKVTFGLELVQ